MPSTKSGRSFVALIRENCSKLGIKVHAYHGDWLLTLKKGKKTEHIFGYDFSLNSAAAQQIAKDKAATYSVLTEAKVSAVEHQLVMSPTLPDYLPAGGNWERLRQLFKRWKNDMVCKPNEGTGGRDVFRARDLVQLEKAIHSLLARTRACTVSPFIEIKDEFRILMLDGQALIAYRKLRPSIVGNGKNRLVDVLAHWLTSDEPNALPSDARLKVLGKLELDSRQLNRIPKAGEIVHLNWRHNLGQGAASEELMQNTAERKKLVKLARAAMNALRLRLASVDIVTDSKGKPQVLEINSGIMMEQLAQTSRARVSGIYGQIIERVFENS